ncbi:MAG: mechanosensitive ion channel family protein [Candidatus Melainabacteria bacterium]|nr:MAG: mechanosensitive ion channel family protein [Candidatus Melainabacteria bacterium]
MLKSLSGVFRKLFPGIVLLTLAYLAGGTDVFSSTVHEHFSRALSEYGSSLGPFAANFLAGALFFWVCWAAHPLLKSWYERLLNRTAASDRLKALVSQTLKLSYWFIAAFVSLSFVAPDLLSKVFLGVSLFGAAIALAFKDIARDGISGFFLTFSPHFGLGDTIELVGTTIKGKISAISYVQTSIETEEGTIVVPNGDMWSKSVKVYKATSEAGPRS